MQLEVPYFPATAFSLNAKPDGINIISTFLIVNFPVGSVNFPLTVTSLLSVSISSFRKVGPPKLDVDG